MVPRQIEEIKMANTVETEPLSQHVAANKPRKRPLKIAMIWQFNAAAIIGACGVLQWTETKTERPMTAQIFPGIYLPKTVVPIERNAATIVIGTS